MRYVVIGLGAVTLALGVVLAGEGLWFVALPDAAFGLGVAWVAYLSLRDEQQDRRAGLLVVPSPPQPVPESVPVPPSPPPPPSTAPAAVLPNLPTRRGKHRRR